MKNYALYIVAICFGVVGFIFGLNINISDEIVIELPECNTSKLEAKADFFNKEATNCLKVYAEMETTLGDCRKDLIRVSEEAAADIICSDKICEQR